MKNNKEKLLKDSLHELDNKLGSILVNIESLRAIDKELGYIREDVDNTDQTDLTSCGLRFRDMTHKIRLMDDLLRYTLKDALENYESCQHVKTELFLEFIQKDKEEF